MKLDLYSHGTAADEEVLYILEHGSEADRTTDRQHNEEDYGHHSGAGQDYEDVIFPEPVLREMYRCGTLQDLVTAGNHDTPVTVADNYHEDEQTEEL